MNYSAVHVSTAT